MKKISKYLLITCVFILGAILLTACNNSEKGYILPSSAEVDSLTVRLPEYNTNYTISGEEREQVISSLRAQPQLEKDKIVINVGKESVSRKALYSLTITTKKKFLKKAKTYSVMVGVVTDRTNMYGTKSTSTDRNELRITGYNGTATGNLFSLVSGIVEREQSKKASDTYDKIIAALTDEGYSFNDLVFDENIINKNNSLHVSLDIKGCVASKSETGSISIRLCKSVEAANERESGMKAGRLYIGAYSQEDYQKIRTIIAS